MEVAIREIILVLGGVASGKSGFAETKFEDLADRHYVATAEAFDIEMENKISQHIQARGPNWKTHEAQRTVPTVLQGLNDKPVLIDCATLWLSNLLMAETDLDPEFDTLIDAVQTHQSKLVIVSNEVGTAPVATTSLGRKFQNAQGRLNRMLADAADQVVLVTAGLPLRLK